MNLIHGYLTSIYIQNTKYIFVVKSGLLIVIQAYRMSDAYVVSI